MNTDITHDTSLSDEAAARLVQSGQTEKFGILVERYEAKLFRYGRKFLSSHENIEDVVQEVFIKVYENIQSFDSSQKFSSWIYRIAHNTYINVLKKNSRMPMHLFDFDELLSYTVVEDPIVREKEQAEIKQLVDHGLEKLAPQYREIVLLYYIEELSYKEISDVLHIPIGTVGIRLMRAKEALKKILEHYGTK